jgi:putative ABC transport system permease protein
MVALRPRNLEVLDRVYIDGAALAFAAMVSILTAVLFGLAPAVTASHVQLQEVLRTGGWGATASSLRARRLLATSQIAIALVLLVGAVLLLRSYARLTAVDPGFDPRGVLSVRVSLPADRYSAHDKARRQAFFDQALTSVQGLPGVRAAAAGNGVPPNSGVMFGDLAIEGRQLDARPGLFSGGYVSPSYFATLRIPIAEGRAFTEDDRQGSEPVAIVGRSFAEQYWPGQSPLGARLRIQSVTDWATVVGVAADVKGVSLAKDSGRLQLYFPRAQTQPGFGAIIVRTDGDPAALTPAIKASLWAIDPKLPLRDIATADQLLARATSPTRFNLALLGAFAACGLALAIVGVYGVMALFVGQRRRELGIRMALGASRRAVAALVIRQTLVVLLCGILAGTAGALLLTRFLQSLLFETPPRDVSSFVLATALIAAASIGATLIPLARAATIAPTIALRED